MDTNQMQQKVQDVAQTLAAKKEGFMKIASVAILAVVGLLVAPFILLSIGGLVGLAVAAAVGFVLVQLAPWFALKVANWRYRLMDAEKVAHIKEVNKAAAENPIETMTVALQQREAAFTRFKGEVETSAAARDTFKKKIDAFAAKYPERAPEFQKQYARMADLVERKKGALKDARKSLDLGAAKLEEMKAYYEMSKDAIELNKAAGMDSGDPYEQMKVDTACDAVFDQMNKAFAQLEVAAALDVNSADNAAANALQLVHSEPNTLDVKVQNVQPVRNQ